MDYLNRAFNPWGKVILSTVGGAVAVAWNSCPLELQYLGGFTLVVVVLDFGLGLGRAVKNREMESDRGWKGVIKWTLYLITISFALAVDRLFLPAVKLPPGFAFTYISLLLISTTESISILEHLAAEGVPIAKPLLELLKRYRIATEKGENKNGEEKPI